MNTLWKYRMLWKYRKVPGAADLALDMARTGLKRAVPAIVFLAAGLGYGWAFFHNWRAAERTRAF